MKRSFKAILLILLAVCVVFLGVRLLQSRQAEQSYAQAEETARPSQPEVLPEPVPEELPAQEPRYDDPYMNELAELDLEALREVNGDVIGWVSIPDTALNYPILQGEDNEYYLERTWDLQKSSAGSIFMEQTNQPDFSDFHTLLYGHRMRDGSMFASLKHYNQKEHWSAHPYVYILTDGGVFRYEIFSAYEAPVKSYTYVIGFEKEGVTEKFLEHCVSSSVIDTGIVPTAEDRILTLSTCTGLGYQSRWVVQARLPAPES